MKPLQKPLRNKLERTIKDARHIAEDAARAALEQIGVGEAAPFVHLSEKDRELRRRLRAHGRQLGDSLDGGKIQTMERLVEEVAYEHWHRMLFARFLAENNLLMYPDPDDPVAVTLEECEDLAVDEGAANGWVLAARFAARMLPQIFRLDSPEFELVLPPEHQQKLERLVADLPQEMFAASDSLGWVYQFWQAKKKEEVNASEVKIGARELPAVTQLFTESYMVSFLLDNSLGAWWAARRLTETDLKNASSELELRQKASIPGVPLEYLRFVRQDDGTWTPAAGTFDNWPERLADLKTLDPCCGSGHFLLAAFLMLVPMRIDRDGLSAKDAVSAVLRENIHGLELDQRCVELAAFALALTAWKYPGTGGYRKLPEMNVACSGLSVSVAKEEWKQLGLGKKNLTIALDWMHDTFRDAPVLGSLLDPSKSDAAKLVEWDELSSALEQALNQEQSEEQQEVAVVAYGLSKAASLLARRYQWVVTNVPYLARGKQNDLLRDFCERHYPAAKNDLATVFLDRSLDLCVEGGTASIVLPQNWLFLTSYKKFREKLLINDTWHFVARLGEGGFDSSAAAGAFVAMITLSRGNSTKASGGLFGDSNGGNLIRGVDVSEPRTASDKAAGLIIAEIKQVEQAKQFANPDSIVQIENSSDQHLLAKVASCFQGTSTGDSERFIQTFWEQSLLEDGYEYLESSPEATAIFAGKSWLILWDLVGSFGGAAVRGREAWGRQGVIIGQMRNLPACLYCGGRFPDKAPVIIPKLDRDLPALYSFCESDFFSTELRKINQKLSVNNGYISKVPFDLDYWAKVAIEKYPDGLPRPYSDDPTQWLFHGHPAQSNESLQVAVARLLGYRWPAELDPGMELSAEACAWVQKSESLLPLADEDGVVCLPPVRGEMSAADRLENLLAVAYGSGWSATKKSELLVQADHGGKTLETWLREKFFTQHCKLFQHRPFVWHIWDGLRDGFAALVNYHKLDAKLMETLIYTYLGDWISRQKQDIASGVDGAQERLAAAEALKKKLELILEGETPNDIFVRWKPLNKQPIGWNPDLNDGVRINIRPFLLVSDVGKKGAGILRDKPNINWNKDRGKDVESAPWYHVFKGDRINDYHLTLVEKRAAREAAE